jgi:hypothetical protein
MESGQRYSLWYSITPSVVGDSVNLATFSLRWKRYTRHDTTNDTTRKRGIPRFSSRPHVRCRKLRAGEPEPDEEEVASSVVLIQERVPPLRISRAPFAATLGTCLHRWLAALWREGG